MYGYGDITPEKTERYCEHHTSPESEVLRALNRETHVKVLSPRMLSGHLQGRLLAAISQMIRPRSILEIGTYTGYSAICLAEGLQPEGKLITIDISHERESMIRHYVHESGNKERIEMLTGPALEWIPKLHSDFDLVFVDADKPSYPAYYDMLVPRLKSGAWILMDNMLWSGKVVEENQRQKDKDAHILHALNEQITQDQRVENILLPIRDGIHLIRKK